jgi:hypothetical protein
MSFAKDTKVYDSILPGPDNKIGPGPNGIPGKPPEGFKPISGAAPAGVSAVASSLLGGSFGTMTPFQIGDTKYMARVEPHYHPPGYKGGPNGWHKGVTVYVAENSNVDFPSPNSNAKPGSVDPEYEPSKPDSGRLQLLKRIDRFLGQISD